MQIFISDVTQDTLPLAKRIKKQLEAQGYHVWLDTDHEAHSKEEHETLHQLATSNCILVLLSANGEHSPTSPHAEEHSYAHDSEKTIIPILTQTVEIPVSLRSHETLDFTEDPVQGMTQLLDRLRRLEHTAPTDHAFRQMVRPNEGRATRDLNPPPNPRITPANVPNLHSVRTMEGHQGYIHAVCFSPDASVLATGSGLTGQNNLLGREKSENVLNLWSVASGELLGTLRGAQREIRTIAFSSDGRLVAATGRNVKLWDVYTHKLIGSLGGHQPYVRGMALSSEAGLIASSSATHSEIHLWDIQKRQMIATLENNEWINCLAFSPDGTRLAVGALSRTISIYDMASHHLLMRLDHHANRIVMPVSGVHVLAFSPDGRMLASVGDDGGISFWDMAHFRRLGHLGGFERDISALSFSPDSQLIACAAGNTLHICDPSREISRLVEHTSPIDDVAWSSTGGLLATVSRDKTVKLWGL